MDPVHDSVKRYYGEVLQSTGDLKTSACCVSEAPSDAVARALDRVPDEVMEKFYGCGNPLPEDVQGLRVLDLGCGSGRDCYVMAALVGEQGVVTGVDMTAQQLDVARRNADEFCVRRLGYKSCNMRFLEGYIEELGSVAGLEAGSQDLVISNCVVNLASDKESVLAGVHSVLREGGEFYFSDVFADRRVPKEIREDEVLYGECLGGAMYTNDFAAMCKRVGFGDPRVVSARPIDISEEMQAVTGNIRFMSITFRLFKLGDLEPDCEDYGQVAKYLGTIPGSRHNYSLDKDHSFETGRPALVCGNTASMLQSTRLAPHFEVLGNRDVHFGEFDCSSGATKASSCTSDGAVEETERPSCCGGGGSGGGCC